MASSLQTLIEAYKEEEEEHSNTRITIIIAYTIVFVCVFVYSNLSGLLKFQVFDARHRGCKSLHARILLLYAQSQHQAKRIFLLMCRYKKKMNTNKQKHASEAAVVRDDAAH